MAFTKEQPDSEALVVRENAETQLKRMESFINSTRQTAMLSVKVGGMFDFYNPATCALSGYTAEELDNGGVYLLFDEETRLRLDTEVVPKIYAEGECVFEADLLRKDGERRLLSCLGFRVGGGADIGYVGTDITEKKKLEQDLIAAKEAAERANFTKSNFLSSMSHEMRTPMNAIIGMTELARETNDQERKIYCLGKIDDASRHLLNVINDVLDMSSIESNKFVLADRVFNPLDMINDLVLMIRFSMDNKRHNFTMNMDDMLPMSVVGDSERLSQVLINLLSNAIKFTPEGGNIVFTAQLKQETKNHYVLQFTVEDNGIGITPAQQVRLFDAFEQADNSISRRYGGTGLGLAISKSIVEMMDGEIGVVSEPDNGAYFFFTVKMQKPHDADGGSYFTETREEFNTSPAKNSLCDHTILLAEDVEINREIVAAMLSDTGIKIEFAENGLDAVAMMDENPKRYSMILMDVQMPQMDGQEATRRIRAMKDTWAKEIPIIAMTANALKEDVEQCIKAGMDGHMGKPMELGILYSHLNRYLKKTTQ